MNPSHLHSTSLFLAIRIVPSAPLTPLPSTTLTTASAGSPTASPLVLLLSQLLGCNPLRFSYSLGEHQHVALLDFERRNGFSERFLNALEQLNVVLCDQGDGATGATSTSRTPNSMDVCFRVLGHVEIDDTVDGGASVNYVSSSESPT